MTFWTSVGYALLGLAGGLGIGLEVRFQCVR